MDNFVESSYQLELDMQKQLFSMEQISAKFDEFGRMYEHIATFGIDSTLVRLFNNDKQLDAIVGTPMPSCEGFELHESPESGLSIAAMEGFGDFFGKIVEFIKNIFKKIWGWIKKIFGMDEYDRVMEQINQTNDYIKKSVDVISAKANMVPDALEKAKSGEITNDDEPTVTCRAFLCDVPTLFDEIDRWIKIVDSKLNGSATPDTIIPLMNTAIEELNKPTKYNPDNPTFKETVEVKKGSVKFHGGLTDRSRIVGAAYLHRISSQKIHSSVKKIQDTVEIYLDKTKKNAATATGKEARTWRKNAEEAQKWALVSAKFVSTIIRKTAAAMRLLRVYVREQNPGRMNSGMDKIYL